jgi:hypothetical protein
VRPPSAMLIKRALKKLRANEDYRDAEEAWKNLTSPLKHGVVLVLAKLHKKSLHLRVKFFQCRRRPSSFNFGTWEP